MGSLDYNVHLQSNFESYLNDAPFLQLYIIWLYKPSSSPWICKCNIKMLFFLSFCRIWCLLHKRWEVTQIVAGQQEPTDLALGRYSGLKGSLFENHH